MLAWGILIACYISDSFGDIMNFFVMVIERVLLDGTKVFSDRQIYKIAIHLKRNDFYVWRTMAFSALAFSALTLLVGRQEGHPACKKLSGEVLAWLSVWSEVQTCTCPADATATHYLLLQ